MGYKMSRNQTCPARPGNCFGAWHPMIILIKSATYAAKGYRVAKKVVLPIQFCPLRTEYLSEYPSYNL